MFNSFELVFTTCLTNRFSRSPSLTRIRLFQNLRVLVSLIVVVVLSIVFMRTTHDTKIRILRLCVVPDLVKLCSLRRMTMKQIKRTRICDTNEVTIRHATVFSRLNVSPNLLLITSFLSPWISTSIHYQDGGYVGSSVGGWRVYLSERGLSLYIFIYRERNRCYTVFVLEG